MNGVYTNLAKKRAEQSKEPVNHGSVPPPPEKPVVQHMPVNVGKPAPLPTRKPTNPSPALLGVEKVEKYTTHIEPSLVKKIQIEAIEKDINDYDVVKIALEQYFENNK